MHTWWSLSGREGFGVLSLPTSLRARDLGIFEEMKCLFSTTLVTEILSKSSWIETEAKGSHWGDRTRDRTHDRMRLARPVSSTGRCVGRRARVCDRSVRTLAGPVRPVTHPGEQREGKV
jgi:hypothetical protein